MSRMGARFFLALLVGSVMAVGGVWVVKSFGWDEAIGGIVWWVVFLVAGLTGTLVDRKGFYGPWDPE